MDSFVLDTTGFKEIMPKMYHLLFITDMPQFGVVPLKYLWSKNDLDQDALGIYLEEGEEVNDALLSNIDKCCHALYITNIRGNRAPLKISCSPEALGRVQPKCLCFMGVLEHLDDAIFQYCPGLEYIWIGASGSDGQPLLDSAPYLSRCPLKYMSLQGYGVVVRGHDLNEIAIRLKETGSDRVQVFF